MRSNADTIRDTFDWQAQLGANPPPALSITPKPRPQIGLAPEREQELLQAWRAPAPAGQAA